MPRRCLGLGIPAVTVLSTLMVQWSSTGLMCMPEDVQEQAGMSVRDV